MMDRFHRRCKIRCPLFPDGIRIHIVRLHLMFFLDMTIERDSQKSTPFIPISSVLGIGHPLNPTHGQGEGIDSGNSCESEANFFNAWSIS